jgi:hypothetical protein
MFSPVIWFPLASNTRVLSPMRMVIRPSFVIITIAFGSTRDTTPLTWADVVLAPKSKTPVVRPSAAINPAAR